MAALTVLAFALRVAYLDRQSLWVDEALSVVFASRPIPELLYTLVTADIHPPLYPLLLHAWFSFAGTSELAVRLPAVIFGTLLVPLVYTLARALAAPPTHRSAERLSEMKGQTAGVAGGLASPPLPPSPPLSPRVPASPRPRVGETRRGGERGTDGEVAGHVPGVRAETRVGHWWGLGAAALVTLSPFLVYFAQEARNYSAVTFWVTLALACLWRAVQAGGRRWWVAYGLATLAALYTHYNAFLMLAALPLLLLLGWQRFGVVLGPWVLTIAAVALLYSPWVAFALAQVTRIDDFWPGTIAFGTVVERTWLAFSSGGQGAWVVPAGILAAILFALGLRPLWHTRLVGERAALLFLLLHLLVPLVGLYALVAFRPKFNARYLIIIAPLFYLVLARGMVALAAPGAPWAGWQTRLRRAFVAVLAVALIVQSAAGVFAVYGDPAYAKEDYRGLVGYIVRHWQPGDVVVLVMDAYQPIVYYGQGQLPYQGLQPYDDQQWAVDRLNEVAARYRRIWLVLWQEDWADPTRYGRHLIEEAGREVPLAVRFDKLGLRLFELPAGTRFRVEPRIDHPAEQRFGDHLLFVGWNAPAEAAAGTEVQYDLHWRALTPPDRDVATTVSIRDTAGRLWAKADCPTGHWPYPPPRWQVGTVVHSQCAVKLPGYLPHGDYRASANLWDRERAAPVQRLDGDGQPAGIEQPLGSLRILPRGDQGAAQLLDRTFPARSQPTLRLRGVEYTPAQARPGDEVELTLHWEALAQPPADYTLDVLLGAAVLLRMPTPAGTEPTGRWPRGAWRLGVASFRVPATVQPGDYPLSVTLRDAAGRTVGDTVEIGQLEVRPASGAGAGGR